MKITENTTETKIEKAPQVQVVEDLINNQPSASLIDMVDSYLSDVVIAKTNLSAYKGQVKRMYLKKCAEFLVKVDPKLWEKIKRSSTQIQRSQDEYAKLELAELEYIEELIDTLNALPYRYNTLVKAFFINQ